MSVDASAWPTHVAAAEAIEPGLTQTGLWLQRHQDPPVPYFTVTHKSVPSSSHQGPPGAALGMTPRGSRPPLPSHSISLSRPRSVVEKLANSNDKTEAEVQAESRASWNSATSTWTERTYASKRQRNQVAAMLVHAMVGTLA